MSNEGEELMPTWALPFFYEWRPCPYRPLTEEFYNEINNSNKPQDHEEDKHRENTHMGVRLPNK